MSAKRRIPFLSPSAVAELLNIFCWGAFSRRTMEEKRSALQLLFEDKKQLNSKVSLVENTQAGIGPFFNASGYNRPPRTCMINEGRGEQLLISPRTAKQYGVNTNGADEDESPLSLHMAPGDLQASSILGQLGEGIYINNLWYLNYSDRLAGRITGMTRFGCFWVFLLRGHV